MSSITIGERAVCDFTDAELEAWAIEGCNGYRPNKGSVALWRGALRHIDQVGPPVTVRQVFYGLASIGLTPKSEDGYRAVQRAVLMMRRHGALPYDFVADNTRWARKPRTYSGLDAYLEEGAKGYRRAVWANQRDYVEVRCEKDALAGVIAEVTKPWDVPLMVSRGFASESYLYEAGAAMAAQAKPCYVYYLGDYDKQGMAISKQVERRLREFGAAFHFERVAVNPEQIEAWNLPTRPAKESAVRQGWQGACVDLDAVPADKLRDLVEGCILRHLDKREYDAMKEAEALERDSLAKLVLVGHMTCS
jgi:hypothetical protein